MANGLKYGIKDLTALQFDGPVVESRDYNACIRIKCSSYDFLDDWVVNPEQPQGGIVVTEHTIEIYSFKPNTWIIKSAYSDSPTKEAFLLRFYGIEWELSALTEHNSYLSYVTSYGSYKPIGIVLSPINSSNTLLTLAGGLDWPISAGCLKDVSGALNYGYINDGKKALYTCSDYFLNNGGSSDNLYNASYPEMALTVFTSNQPAQDGNIHIIDSKAIVNPTNIEGYKAYVGEDQVYNKAMTFQNVLMRHGCAFKETGTFTESIQSGVRPAITSHYGNEQNTAFVISIRNYSDTYGNLRLPYITDLEQLIAGNFPFKFWAQLERDSNYSHIWDSLRAAFRNQDVIDGTFANHLFSKSTGDEVQFYIGFDVGADTYIDMDGIFDHSTLYSDIFINITSGILKTLHDAFRQTKRLQSLAFNTEVRITDFCGAFEGTALEDFPTNVVPRDMWPDNASLSQPTCDIHYAADGSALEWFGNYKNQSALDPEDMCYTLTVDPQCYGAFRANNLSEIKYLLDMKFVSPIAWNIIDDGPDSIYNNAVFYAPNLAVAYIKNLNKGDWSLDGTKRNGVCAGNLTQFDEDCANYMLSNLFDLRLNTSMQSRLESNFNSFNGWTASSGTKRPISWEVWETSTLRRSVYPSGQMKINVSLYNCTLSLTNGGSTTTVNAGDSTLNLSSGETVFTFTKTDSEQDMVGVITLTEPFMSELTQGLSSANIYLPVDWGTRNIISSTALTEANNRGWTVYVGGTVYSV